MSISDKDLEKIIRESKRMIEGFTTPDQYHKWLLRQFSHQCFECKGAGLVKDIYNNDYECSACRGLGVHIRKNVISEETCITCKYYLADSQSCKLPNIKNIDNPRGGRCAAYDGIKFSILKLEEQVSAESAQNMDPISEEGD